MAPAAWLAIAALSGAPVAAQEGARPLYSGDDLLFLHHMIMHHQQAVDMGQLVPSRSDREAFVKFTDYVARAQAAEIALMQSWLDLAAARGQQVPEHPPHGDPPMHGMLSSAQIAALEATTGAEFERLWLEGMIVHHEGAIHMSHAQQAHQLATGRRPYGLSVLVEEILVEQRAEITRMRGWLQEWGLAAGAAGDSHAGH
jgi:uncharacterized protein (DUF305 family)